MHLPCRECKLWYLGEIEKKTKIWYKNWIDHFKNFINIYLVRYLAKNQYIQNCNNTSTHI